MCVFFEVTSHHNGTAYVKGTNKLNCPDRQLEQNLSIISVLGFVPQSSYSN